MLRQQMLEEKIRILALIDETRRRLARLPKGTFYSVRNGRYTKWFSCFNGKKSLISKANKPLAKKLALGTLYKYLLQQEEQELQAIKAYLRNAGDLDIKEFLDDHEEIRRLLSDGLSTHSDVRQPFADSFHPADNSLIQDRIQKWMDEPYPKNPIPYKGTLYKTLKGDLVKSLAEQTIADALFLADIPYRYECGISFNGGKTMYYPDFMIMHPITGEIFLWEHFGMSELTYYCRKNADKMYTYFDNGYVPGKNLICTAETDRVKLTPAQVQKQIDYYFGNLHQEINGLL